MDSELTMRDRIRGVAVGAAAGDALGMTLEFKSKRPHDQLVREMLPGRLPAGTFTDDTEMALALADSLLAQRPLDPADLARRFVAWYAAEPGRCSRASLPASPGSRLWRPCTACARSRPATAP